MNNLNDKTALVTGSARRIGAEIVRMLHTDGANVAIHYRRSADDADRLCAELNAVRPDSALTLQADLLDTEAVSLAELVGVRNYEISVEVSEKNLL